MLFYILPVFQEGLGIQSVLYSHVSYALGSHVENVTHGCQRSPDTGHISAESHRDGPESRDRVLGARPAHPRVALRLWMLVHGLLQAPGGGGLA